MGEIHQGDILKIEKIRQPVLVASKDFFNSSGEIIGCPIYADLIKSPLHIYISGKEIEGYVQCEKITLFDLDIRGHKRIDRIAMKDLMNVTDAIQGIFDYI